MTLRYIKNIDSDLLNKLNELKDHMNLTDVLLYGNKSKKESNGKRYSSSF